MNRYTILITQPDFDRTTRYVSIWSEEVEEFSNTRGHKTEPQLVMFNGHGNDSEIYGQDNEILLDHRSIETTIDGRIIYALACSSAKSLGKVCITNRAKAFIGYTDDFIFLHHYPKISKPREDKRARLFFKPSNLIPISLIKGNTTGYSYIASKNLLKKNILELLTSEVYNEDRICLRYLTWNYQNLTLLGDTKAKL